MKRPVKAPLLIIGCSCCMRRRACVPMRYLGLWLCRQCCARVGRSSVVALAWFQAQAR